MITVVGSYAVGMTMFTGRFPLSGETLIGKGYRAEFGGKGSNQAVAMARLGIEPYFVACVGEDHFGREALEMYRAEGVNAAGVRFCSGVSTGVGFIIVDRGGNNIITLDMGANECLSLEDVNAAGEVLDRSSSLVMQLEISPQIVLYSAKLARIKRIPVILNPAPYQELPEEIWSLVDIVVPNETEARLIVGRKPDDPIPVERLAEEILGLGVKTAVITLGEKGAYLATWDGERMLVPAFSVTAIDTTGAGDTFTAALAVALSENRALPEAVRFANAAAAITCTGRGVVPALPYRKQVEALLKRD